MIDKKFVAIVLVVGLLLSTSCVVCQDKYAQDFAAKEQAGIIPGFEQPIGAAKENDGKEPIWEQVQSTTQALAAEPGQSQPIPYVKIRSSGTIITYCNEASKESDFCPVYGFNYQDSVPAPFIITKKIDKVSPFLFKALTQKEPVELEMRLYYIEPDGRETHYFTVKLDGAAVIGMKQYRLTNTDSSGWSDFEDVTFTYQRLTWTYIPDGTEHQAEW